MLPAESFRHQWHQVRAATSKQNGTDGHTLRILPLRIDHRALRCRRCVPRIRMCSLVTTVWGPRLASPISQAFGGGLGHALPPHITIWGQRSVCEDEVLLQCLHCTQIADDGSHEHTMLPAGSFRHQWHQVRAATFKQNGTDGYTLRILPLRIDHKALRCRRHVPRIRMCSLATTVWGSRLASPNNQAFGGGLGHALPLHIIIWGQRNVCEDGVLLQCLHCTRIADDGSHEHTMLPAGSFRHQWHQVRAATSKQKGTDGHILRILPLRIDHRALRCRRRVRCIRMCSLATTVWGSRLASPINEAF